MCKLRHFVWIIASVLRVCVYDYPGQECESVVGSSFWFYFVAESYTRLQLHVFIVCYCV